MKRKRKLILKKLETYKEVIKLNKHIEKEFKWIIEEIKDHKSAPEMIKSLRKDVLDICEGPPLSQQRDCTDLKKLNKMTGVHTIYPDNVHGVKVFCNMEVDGGGWSVIQRRQDGTTNFYRSWSEYKSGFGSPDKNVWLGDSLRYQNGMKFSTYDQDNDAYKAVDCVARDHAGWWYNQCHNVNINGLYKKGKSDKHNVVSWNLARGPYYSLKFVRMMIRRH
ncbi:Hypothetical predicted protein [Mytilus galloprovincialis]|uniref:Fibrinogen C-terminal domain-containing protein n=1 Tax=Mytilus galloprovincialis TaxID=29158 RepID=A0A8B6H7Y1_MYTGA|nr:Hypothetical predicted protein [Mytilus galloprovincialis]